MVWQIEFTETSLKQLKKIDRTVAKRIIEFMKIRISTQQDPRISGKALQGKSLGTYWRYRVGDYRIICDIQEQKLIVLVLEVGHRKDIYLER